MTSRSLDEFPGETLTIPEAGQVLGWGRRRAYQAARAGELPLLPVGYAAHNQRVPKHALRQLLETGTWDGRKPQLQVIRGGNRAA